MELRVEVSSRNKMLFYCVGSVGGDNANFQQTPPGAASLVSVFLPRCFLVYIFVDISHIFEVGKALRC